MYAIRGLVLNNAGRRTEARAAYEHALELYERKGAVPAAELVRADLAGLPA